MTKQLQEKLYQDFPDLFQNKSLPMSKSCMYWGVDVDDGWEPIIRQMCNSLAYVMDKYDVKVVFDQIKEKFGTLTVYHHTVYGKSWKHKKCYVLNFIESICRKFRFWKKAQIVANYRFGKEWSLNGKNKIPYSRNGWSDYSRKMNAAKGVDELVQDIISHARKASEIVCENCGITGADQNSRGWIKTLCEECKQKKSQF